MIKVSRSGNHILISGCVSERDRQKRLLYELMFVTVLQTLRQIHSQKDGINV